MKILEHTDSGTCTKSLKIEIPPESIDQERDGVYKDFMAEATVPGFRKGKAPKKIVQMKFGKHIDREAIGKAVETALKDAVEELKLRPANQPEIGELDEKATGDDPIVFEAKLEYIPDIELAEYKDIRPTLPETEVSEKEITETLDRLRDQNAIYSTVDDRPVTEGDFVTVSCNATIDGELFAEATHDSIPVEIGTERYIPGFEKEITGMDINEEKTFTLTLPDDYPQEERRGKEAEFNVTVTQIQEKKLPELDDEFAKDLGVFESLQELKDRIRQDLEAGQEQRKAEALQQGIREELLKRHNFDVPPSMVKGRYEYINAMQDQHYRRYGQTLEIAASEDEGLLARNEETALQEVRTSLILDKIAETESLELTEDDFVSYLTTMAAQSGVSPQAVVERIQQQGMDTYYRRMALEEKVMNWLVSLTKEESAPVKKSKTEPKETAAAEADETEE